MSNKRQGELEVAHSKRSNVVMREKQNDRMSVFAGYSGGEQPMDLTKKTNSKTTANNDLTVSAREAPSVVNLDSEDDTSDDIGRAKLIMKLTDELRNEESKLIFLKQLRYNQRLNSTDSGHSQLSQAQGPAANAHSNANPAHSQVVAGRTAINGLSKAHSGSVNTVAAHGGSVSNNTVASQGRNHSQPPQTQRPGISAQDVKRPTPSAAQPPNRGSGQFHQNSATANQGSTPRQTVPNNTPTTVQAPPQPAQPPPPPKPVVLDENQKQAARGALRRQLEKTLLAIPPPKALPPELSFIPSLISNDFVKLLGLEEVVKMLLDIQRQEKRDIKYVFNPFRCSQCKSDFTPVWKREKPGSKNVICEQCVTSNQKRTLRQEHTARLKSAFLKAAEQQQDLEEQLKKNIIPASLVPLMPHGLQPQSQSTPQSMQGAAYRQQQLSHQDRTSAANISQTTPQISAAHSGASAMAAQRDRAREREQEREREREREQATAALNAAAAFTNPAQVNAAVAQLASQLLPQSLPGASSPQSLLGMAYIQQQLAALTSQPSNFGIGSATIAAAAAALNPAQRQLLLDQLSQQAKQFGWKG